MRNLGLRLGETLPVACNPENSRGMHRNRERLCRSDPETSDPSNAKIVDETGTGLTSARKIDSHLTN